jgi:hypothetical protein
MRNPMPAGQPEGMATGRNLVVVFRSFRIGCFRVIAVESPNGP